MLPALCFISLLFSRAHKLSVVIAFLSLFCCGELFLQCKAAGNARVHTIHKETHPMASHKSSRVSMAFFNLLARFHDTGGLRDIGLVKEPDLLIIRKVAVQLLLCLGISNPTDLMSCVY